MYKKKIKEWERFGSVAGELTRGSKTPGAGGCRRMQLREDEGGHTKAFQLVFMLD